MKVLQMNLLAFDFGASSGRVVLEKYNGGELEIQIIHRFANDPIEVSGQILRCVFKSLALKYRWVIDKLEEIVGDKRIGTLYTV